MMFKAYINDKCFYDDGEYNENISDLVLTLEENKAGSFEFTLYPAHPFFSDFDKLNSIITVKQHDEIIFRGRVIESKDDFNNKRTICCEGELAFFNDSVVFPYGFADEEGSTTETAVSVLTKILSNHNAQVDKKRQFVLGSITISDSNKSVPYAQMEYVKSIDAINSMLETFGGHIMFRHEDDLTFIDWTESYPTINQDVEFGENLLDLTQNVQGDDIITAILPIGDKNDETQLPTNISEMFIKETELHRQIGEYIINIPLYEKYGLILEVKNYEGFPADWIDKVLEEVDNLSGLENSIEVSALDVAWLNDVNVFSISKSVQVTSPYHNVNGKYNLTKLKLNLQNPDDNTFTFGKVIKGFIDQIIGDNSNKTENLQTKPKAYEYAYANNDNKTERPDDNEFKPDTLPIEGKIYWVRVTTIFSDGTKNVIYYSQDTNAEKVFAIESDTASVIRNDRLTTSQTITFIAKINCYPQANPKWYIDGKLIGEGSPIKVEIPYRNANSISVNLFNGSTLMNTLNLPVTDKTGGSMYLGTYDTTVPTEAFDDKGNALMIMKGDYFLCSKNFFPNFEAGNPYVWTGHSWELTELSKNVNAQEFGQIMSNALNDALSCDTVENTKFMSWFKRLAGNEGFIRDLIVYALRVGSGNDTDGFIMKIIDGDPPTIVAKYKGQVLWEIDAKQGKMYGNFSRVLQYLPFNFDDSLDSSHPFECVFYIPENSEIKSLKLSVKGEKYRAYSTAAVHISDYKLTTGDVTWGSANPFGFKLDLTVTKTNYYVDTVESSGSHHHRYTTVSGVGGYFGDGEHTHTVNNGVAQSSGSAHMHNVTTEALDTSDDGSHSHYLPSLVKDVSGTVDTSGSNFGHTHDLDVSHGHDLTFGIYEGTYPRDVKLFIDNGVGYSSSPIELGSSEMLATNLDISEYFSETGWKKMKFTSTTLGRLTVQLMAELYINT